MKKISQIISVLTLAAFLTFTTPAVAQTPDNNSANTTRVEDEHANDDGDEGKWGLAGLLGLLGLLGLKRRDDDRRPGNR